MPRLKWSRTAVLDLQRLHTFLVTKNPEAAQRAIRTIRTSAKALSRFPEIGRHVPGFPEWFREWIVPFGQGAYVVFYEVTRFEVVLLSIRHSRELSE